MTSARSAGDSTEPCARAVALRPDSLTYIENLASLALLARGDLGGARGVVRAAPANLDHGTLVPYFAQYGDLAPVQQFPLNGGHDLKILAWIYTLTGQQEKAIHALDQLLTVPYCLSPAWLRIDPT